jgi:hypothetical protein
MATLLFDQLGFDEHDEEFLPSQRVMQVDVSQCIYLFLHGLYSVTFASEVARMKREHLIPHTLHGAMDYITMWYDQEVKTLRAMNRQPTYKEKFDKKKEHSSKPSADTQETIMVTSSTSPQQNNNHSNNSRGAHSDTNNNPTPPQVNPPKKKNPPGCILCGGPHSAQFCPKRDLFVLKEGATLHYLPQISFNNGEITLNSNLSTLSNPNVIILDSGSSISLFRNPDYLLNMETGPEITLKGVGSTPLTTNLHGDTADFGPVIFSEHAPTNILSLDRISRLYNITFNNQQMSFTLVNKLNPSKIFIFQHLNGLYVMEHQPISPDIGIPSTGSLFLSIPDYQPILIATPSHHTYNVRSVINSIETTIKQNQITNSYSKLQISRAKSALELYDILNCPSDEVFIRALDHGTFIDCRTTSNDFRLARKLWGPSPHALLGKMKKNSRKLIDDIPADKVGQILHSDIVFIPGPNSRQIPHLLSVDDHTGLSLCTKMRNKKTIELTRAFKAHINRYQLFNHTVSIIKTDCESVITATRPALEKLKIQLHQTGPGLHESVAENKTATLKSKFRSTLLRLPYTLPKQLFSSLWYDVIATDNMMPNSKLIDSRSPIEVMTGTKINVKTCLRAAFGQYCIAWEPNKTKEQSFQNSSQEGIIIGRDAINNRGSVKIFLLHNLEIVTRD